MALKYYFTYKDVRDNEFLCEIREEAYTGVAQEIKGTCILSMPRFDNIYTVLRGRGMTVHLEANINLTLEDLYSDNVQAFSVTLQRNGKYIFRGFIDPNGLYEDLVEDAWIVSLDCVDGLGLLEDISYLDTEGNVFVGRLRDLEVINNCLARGGATLPGGAPLFVQTSINTRYSGLGPLEDPLLNTFTNQERFYRDDGNTVMSCKEVLESTLRKYGAFIYYSEDIWRIHTFYEVSSTALRSFYTYRLLRLQNVTMRTNTTTYIGSDINDAHRWVNRNQRKEIVPPSGAVTVNYDYGFVASLILNPMLVSDDGLIPGWDIIAPDVVIRESGSGVRYISAPGEDALLVSDPQTVQEGEELNLRVVHSYEDVQIEFLTRIVISVCVILQGSDGVTYYLNNDGNWVQSEVCVRRGYNVFNLSADQAYDLEISPVPVDGELSVVVNRIRTRQLPALGPITDYERVVFLEELSITPDVSDNIQGETHTCQVANGSFRSEEVVEVSVGDVPSDIYLGALYQKDADTNTRLWRTIGLQPGQSPRQSLLEILCEQIAQFRRDPTYLIRGDVFGQFEIDTLFRFDLTPGRVLMCTYYEYDTVNNVITAEWKELRRGSSEGLTYSYELDYGNAEKPTVIGV